MNKIPDPATLVGRLERAGLTIDVQEIGAPVSKDNRDFIALLGLTPAPPVIDKIYKKFDRFSLAWHGRCQGYDLQGAINIIAFDLSLARAPTDDKNEPLEGILWTYDTPDKARSELQRMTIFETVQGRSQFITYINEDKVPRMFLVDRDYIRPLATDFIETLQALLDHAGAEGMREYLTHPDWKERLESDERIKAIRALP